MARKGGAVIRPGVSPFLAAQIRSAWAETFAEPLLEELANRLEARDREIAERPTYEDWDAKHRDAFPCIAAPDVDWTAMHGDGSPPSTRL